MKYHSTPLITGLLLLSACTWGQSNSTQTDYMAMDNDMMQENTTMHSDGTPVLPSDRGVDLSMLPNAKPSSTINVPDGGTIDLNPQIVKKMINGKPFASYTYNGQFPGPILRVKQGSTFTVRVRNGIDQPTTVHWHGLRLDNRFDGVPEVTQEAIQPGDSFTYSVIAPDEGMFWYHPHVREDMQQDLGLYGGILVTPRDDTAYAPVNDQQVVFLDDILLGKSGVPVPYGKDDADHALMGRFGNIMLINGEVNPTLPSVRKGDVVRFYLANTANTRTFKVAFRGAQMKLVGGDNGRYETEQFIDSVIVAPSERMIVDVFFSQPGTVQLVQLMPAERELARIEVGSNAADPSYAQEFKALRTNADVVADIATFKPFFTKVPDKILHLSVNTRMMAGMHGGMGMGQESPDGIEWEDTMRVMNAASTKANTQWKLIDEVTQQEGMNIDYGFAIGERVKIRLVNDTDSAHPMQHPIHFHGNRFLVLSDNGIPNDDLVWKDTVLVPSGHTIDILLETSNPGDWMFHCHISEHLTNGMMGQYTVE